MLRSPTGSKVRNVSPSTSTSKSGGPTPLPEVTNDREESASLLLAAGLPAAYVANSLRLPLDSVTRLATVHTTSRTFIPEDRELADKVRGLISYAIDEAFFEIKFGDPHTRAALIKTLVARGAGLVGQEGSGKEEFLLMWDDLMRDTRDPDKHFDETIIDALADDE